eukprot:m.18863 g.18863  ORF g.18863 m.18863 type:complete len:322 (+) comp8569_c0_seq1:750-1715(+)
MCNACLDNTPDADEVVRVASVEGLTISGPSEGEASWGLTSLGGIVDELVDEGLGLEIPDLDGRTGSSAEPVAVGAEDEGVDHVLSLEGGEMAVLGQVPEHGKTVLATRGAEGTIRGDGDSVEVASVANVVALQAASGQVPDLDLVVPTAGDNDGVIDIWGEADAGDPLGVTLVADDVLALSKDVPQADGFIAGSGDNLAIVRGEGDGEDVLGVANEAALADTSGDLPEAHGVIPRAREGELAIRGDDNVRDEVGVAAHGTQSETALLSAGGQLPDDDGLIARGREDGVGDDGGGGNLGNPSRVALELASEDNLGLVVRHGW